MSSRIPCSQIELHLLGDAADPLPAAQVQAHLGSCPACKALGDAHRHAAETMARVRLQAPDRIWQGIAAGLALRSGAGGPAPSAPPGGLAALPAALWLAVTGAAVAVVALLALGTALRSPPPVPPSGPERPPAAVPLSGTTTGPSAQVLELTTSASGPSVQVTSSPPPPPDSPRELQDEPAPVEATAPVSASTGTAGVRQPRPGGRVRGDF